MQKYARLQQTLLNEKHGQNLVIYVCLRPFEANLICLKCQNFSKSDGPTQAEFYAQQSGVIYEKNRSMCIL